MQRFSGFSLLRNAFSHHENWQRMWRNPTPKPLYDVLIVGGGGHGLATAYYLAKEFGVKNVAVVAIPHAIPLSSAPIICGMNPPACTSTRSSSGRVYRRI